MGKTIAEKILSDHAGKELRAGDIAICDVDFCFGQDGTSSIIIDSFKKLGVKRKLILQVPGVLLRIKMVRKLSPE